MTRGLDAATLTALSDTNVSWVALIKLEFTSTTIWETTAAAAISYGGDTYNSSGILGNLSEIKEKDDLSVQNYQLTLSGVSSAVLSAVVGERSRNRPATIWVAPVNSTTYSVIGNGILFFKGIIDSQTLSYGKQPTISLRLTSAKSDWQRPRIERYTNEEQQAQYPGDLGLEFVAEVGSKEIIWPSRSWFKKNS